jgi:DNA-binding CsgD family transcriptional regulator
VILLDRAGRVVATNRSAAAILSRADGLMVVRNELAAASERDTAALRALIGEAGSSRADRTPGSADGAMRLARPSMLRALNVLVTPLNSAALSDIQRRAVVAVFVSDPEERIDAPVDALRHHLGLTPAEAALVLALTQGKSIEAAAEEKGISVLTARTRLKRALTKTGTRRQSDLVRLALASPAQFIRNAARSPVRPP